MSETIGLVEEAFQRLSEKPGFVDRPNQRQLALLVHDCISAGVSGAFEAPTGLGKSLAVLIPAIAHAVVSKKRTVISTFTNVLAEQYWRNDVPLALSLFDAAPTIEFLIGRQRYACLIHIEQHAPRFKSKFVRHADKGIESEFRNLIRLGASEEARVWSEIAAPPVCPGKLCAKYDQCFYYRSRRSAERAEIVITNHSVVLQDAILREASGRELSLLGDVDFIVLDEAHDFAQAALGSFEFELSEERIGVLIGVVNKAEESVLEIVSEAHSSKVWLDACEEFRVALSECAKLLREYGLRLPRSGILVTSPADLEEHPQVKSMALKELFDRAKQVANEVQSQVDRFVGVMYSLIEKWEERGLGKAAEDTLRNYALFIREFGAGARSIFSPTGVSVSYADRVEKGARLRYEVVGIAEPLKRLVWDRFPTASLSATLALDGKLEFYMNTTGCYPKVREILPTPFDFRTQAALYLPRPGVIPDPTVARREGSEGEYFDAIASELSKIIDAMHGRTLALFHSRREMDEVFARMKVGGDLPIYVQGQSGVASVGARFKSEKNASLFALRSFWTGFDAPGETLSCVVLVRVPFEVPVEPPQVVRQAWLESRGLNPFMHYSLPLAKMLMRQGAGRLIRTAEDRGVIAILDSRITGKRYGKEIVKNLPEGMRTFHDIQEAVAHVGLDEIA